MASKTEIIRDEQAFGCRTCCCVGCGGIIQDRYIMQVSPDLKWHARCLKCVECQGSLDERCYMRSGKTYCRDDYNRLFRPTCQQCREPISSSELVIRTRELVYHVGCFQCRTCCRRLNPGDEYCFREDGSIVCRTDFDLTNQENGSGRLTSTPVTVKELGGMTPGSTVGTNGPGCLDDSRGGDSDSERGGPNSACNMVDSPHDSSSGLSVDGSSSIGGCSSTHTSAPIPTQNGSNSNSTNGGSGGNSVSGSKSSSSKNRQKDTKQTRVRTVLNEKQLHTLKTCYAANPRPDALMKEQLTEMTGLTSRVIRVWFQNKRCKDKKKQILMKQMEQQQNKNGGIQRPLQGMPMVASSPMRHDPNLNPTPVEVQQFPGPVGWKMPEFPSLAPELPPDHPPPFQQLINTFDGARPDPSHYASLPPPSCIPSDLVPPVQLHLGHSDPDQYPLHRPPSFPGAINLPLDGPIPRGISPNPNI